MPSFKNEQPEDSRPATEYGGLRVSTRLSTDSSIMSASKKAGMVQKAANFEWQIVLGQWSGVANWCDRIRFIASDNETGEMKRKR